MDPSTFLGSVWGMNWGVFCTFSGDSGGVWIHRVYIYILNRYSYLDCMFLYFSQTPCCHCQAAAGAADFMQPDFMQPDFMQPDFMGEFYGLWGISHDIPSGKRLHNYGKSPFVMGKSTIQWPFSIAMFVYQRVTHNQHEFNGFW